ncbi:MAG: thymidine phosphorylase [Bacilli bacterium]|nr:thymidine phosphorylase [Bacilli bacterium]
MNILEIINKKKNKEFLTKEELSFAFNGYDKGDILDYQMASLLMAITINGLTEEEVFNLTEIFIESGEKVSFEGIDYVDKHSTGGIGDKTTLIVAPIVASCGIPILKMSGRGLGHTGGTIDKLESIKDFKINLSIEEIKESLIKNKIVLVGQSANIAPLDKKIYLLRDVTSTVESIDLIAVSIMSKKIALGAKNIVIDLKVGNGALVKNMNDAHLLASLMKKIGTKFGRNVSFIISNMENPLGLTIGNSLEVIESIQVLKGNGAYDITNLSLVLSAKLIEMHKKIDFEEAFMMAKNALDKGLAFNKFLELIKNQDGILGSLTKAKNEMVIYSQKTGYVTSIDIDTSLQPRASSSCFLFSLSVS